MDVESLGHLPRSCVRCAGMKSIMMTRVRIGGGSLLDYRCYSCGEVIECPTCGHEEWEEGISYDLNDFPLEKQERFVFYGECCVCGSTRTEQ